MIKPLAAAGFALAVASGASAATFTYVASEVAVGNTGTAGVVRDQFRVARSIPNAFGSNGVADIQTGEARFLAAKSENPSDFVDPPTTITVDTGLFLRFDYTGAPLTLPQGAIRFAADGSFSRIFFGNALTGSGSTSTGVSFSVEGGNDSAFVRSDWGVTESLNFTTIPPNGIIQPLPPTFAFRNSVLGDSSLIARRTVTANRFDKLFLSPELTLENGDSLLINVGFSGSAGSSSIGNRDGTPGQGQFRSNGSSTGALSLFLPEGAALAGLPNDVELDWVRFGAPPPIAPIPLPAAGWLLTAGLGCLIALRRKAR